MDIHPSREEDFMEKDLPADEMEKILSVPYKPEEEVIKETENVFGTSIPMKNITEPAPVKNQWLNKGGLSGVDQYILNRYK